MFKTITFKIIKYLVKNKVCFGFYKQEYLKSSILFSYHLKLQINLNYKANGKINKRNTWTRSYFCAGESGNDLNSDIKFNNFV